jgi:hypothetical protein
VWLPVSINGCTAREAAHKRSGCPGKRKQWKPQRRNAELERRARGSREIKDCAPRITLADRQGSTVNVRVVSKRVQATASCRIELRLTGGTASCCKADVESLSEKDRRGIMMRWTANMPSIAHQTSPRHKLHARSWPQNKKCTVARRSLIGRETRWHVFCCSHDDIFCPARWQKSFQVSCRQWLNCAAAPGFILFFSGLLPLASVRCTKSWVFA